MMMFHKPIKPEMITLSSVVNTSGWVFPPKDIKIFGGMDAKNLKPLYHLKPAQDTLPQSNYLIPYECKITTSPVKYIKVVVEPIGKVPKQFIPPPEKPKKEEPPKKGEKPKRKEKPKPPNYNGWFFIDEIFVN